MMSTLDDFNNTTTNSLEDFAPKVEDVAPVSNRASNTNLAAHAAAFTPGPDNLVSNYRAISSDLDQSGQSQLATQLVSEVRQRSFDKARTSLIQVLSDPSVSDEDKRQAANNVYDAKNPLYDHQNLLSSEALEAPVKNESVEAEASRISIAGALNEVNQIKYAQQQMLNSTIAQHDPDMQEKLVGIMESMAPGVNQKITGGIRAEATGDNLWSYVKSVLAPGSAKADLRDMVQNVPPDQRIAMTVKMIDAINAHPGISMSSPNDFIRAQYLQQVIQTGAYTSHDEWVDNIAGAMDMTFFGGLAVRGVRGLGAAGKAASEAAAAERFVASGPNPPKGSPSLGAQPPKGTPNQQVTSEVESFLNSKLNDKLNEAAWGDAVDNFMADSVKSRVQPSTVSQNYKDTNIDKFRGVHEAAASDTTDEAAQALYGTNRADAVANDLGPEIGHADGSVKAKPNEPDALNNAKMAPDPEVRDFVEWDGATQYTQEEKAITRSQKVNDFKQAMQLGDRKEMFQVLHFEAPDTPNGVDIKAVYGPQAGGYTNPEDAIELAKFALRDFGIDDSNITLLQRQGGDYVPTTLEKARAAPPGQNVSLGGNGGDYLIQIDHNYKFSPGDIGKWSELGVKWNPFDRLGVFNGSSGAGSLNRHFFDIASMLDPTITKSATTATYKAAGLERANLKLGDIFAKSFVKLPVEAKSKVYDMIKEANLKGLDFDYNKAVASGMRNEEIDTLKAWRSYWDNQYWLDNRDLSKSLRARGFQQYVDPVKETNLFVRPLGRQSVGGSAKIYDVNTGEINFVRGADLDNLYKSGGTIAQMRTPIRVGDDAAELIISPNKAGAGYLKALSDNSQVLGYRKGYYSVRYKDPHFIIKKEVDSNGKLLYEHAVATAGSVKDADLMVRRMKATDGGEYYHRLDKNMDRNTPNSDHTWDLHQAGGRSTQRVRGKRLEDTTSNVTDPSMNHIEGPVETMINSARSISRRVAMRDTIEATKARFINQYGDYLPDGPYGKKVYPAKHDDIGYRGGKTPNSKKLADARSTYEYINYLENGYINAIDDGFKALMNTTADILGGHGWSGGEKGARWLARGRGPIGVAKNAAMTLYISTAPFRQIFIQAHQAMQLLAINPVWVMRTDLSANQTIGIIMKQLGQEVPEFMLKGMGETKESFNTIFKHFQRSGMSANIDKHNLVRGGMMDIVDQMSSNNPYVTGANKVLASPGKVIHAMRRAGFDAGENVTVITSWLAFRDRVMRKGLDVNDPEVLDNVGAEAGNYTYNMHSGGDMPYNQNALSPVLQFQQVGHKAILTMTTNRILTPWEKSRLIAMNLLMYGVPTGAVATWMGRAMPDNQFARDVITSGVEGALLNKLASVLSGGKSRIDFSGISPVNMYGTMDLIHSIFTSDVGTIISKTPSGQLFFGGNARLTNFVRTAAQYFNLVDKAGDPVKFSQVAMDFCKLSSGCSNAFKASYALKYGQKINSSNKVTDSNVSTPEAIAQAFGFTTLDEAFKYKIQSDDAESYKELKDDVGIFYNNMKKDLLKDGLSPDQFDYIQQVHTEAFRVWGNDNAAAKQEIEKLLVRDIQNGDDTMYRSLLQATDYQNREQSLNKINNLPDITEEQKAQFKDTINFIYDYKDKGERE